jgi:hypothetical protein
VRVPRHMILVASAAVKKKSLLTCRLSTLRANNSGGRCGTKTHKASVVFAKFTVVCSFVLLDRESQCVLEVGRLELDDLAQGVELLGALVVLIALALEPDAESVWHVAARSRQEKRQRKGGEAMRVSTSGNRGLVVYRVEKGEGH